MPRQQTWLARAWTSARRNPIKASSAVFAWLVTVDTLYAQWDNVTGAFLHVWPPSTAYAQSYVDTRIAKHVEQHRVEQAPLLGAVRDLQIEGAEGKRDAAKEAKAKWMLERGKTQDASIRDLIDAHVEELDVAVNRLNSQIRTLNKLKDAR